MMIQKCISSTGIAESDLEKYNVYEPVIRKVQWNHQKHNILDD